MMKTSGKVTSGIGKVFDAIAGGALIAMVSITAVDIILRYFRMPIVGSYEIVSMLGGLVVGCALPQTSVEKAHVIMDILIEKLPQRRQVPFLITTRIAVMVLFFLFGWNLLDMARMFYESGESSLTLTLPLYPAVFIIGICCFSECVVMLFELVSIIRRNEGKHE
ncbi:MAG: TRAP transporter small permease [Alphaproteobacteria bacterium]